MIKNFSIIVSNTSRSLSYLNILKKNNFTPNFIIYLEDKNKDKISNLIRKKINKFPKRKIKTLLKTKIDTKIDKLLIKLHDKFIIYSGYPGILVKSSKLLKKKIIIHNHSGKIPEFKGSTTIYYSLLKEKKIYCSTIILNNKIDEGKILFIKKYPIPKNIMLIDNKYDDYIRSNNLILFMKSFKKLNVRSKKKSNLQPYYVIHPLLRSIVFKKFMKKYK
tara:strand:- start:234 stop:890 length:657 start_codon:yes stop_codon:yes gene_type:complete